MSPKRRPATHWRVSELSSFSAMFSQLPCLGVWQKSMRRTKTGRAWAGAKRFVEGTLRMRVQVVAHDDDFAATPA